MMSQNGLESGTSNVTILLLPTQGRDTLVRSFWKQVSADANSGLEALYLIADDVTCVLAAASQKIPATFSS